MLINTGATLFTLNADISAVESKPAKVKPFAAVRVIVAVYVSPQINLAGLPFQLRAAVKFRLLLIAVLGTAPAAGVVTPVKAVAAPTEIRLPV